MRPPPAHLSRRQLLAAGLSGLVPLAGLRPTFAADRRVAAKSVLVILEQGGLSQMDTWDPKPDAVAEHRSPFRPISTSVPGMRFTELLTHTSRVAHKLAVVRSMRHAKNGASGHGEGTQYMLSGAHPGGAVRMPDLGAVAAHTLGTAAHFLPPYVMVPGNHEQANVTSTGFLPVGTKAFKTGGADLSAAGWKVGALEPRPDTPADRLAEREKLLAGLNAANR